MTMTKAMLARFSVETLQRMALEGTTLSAEDCETIAAAIRDKQKATGSRRRQHILDTVEDLVGRFMFYDRKEDEDLPRGAIEEAVAAGEITKDEIVAHFASKLRL